MFSPYDHFPNHNYVEGEPYIACYNDRYVMTENVEENSVALLIEPRSLIPKNYKYIEEHPDKFKIVFTHDSILLSTLPNAHHILYGGVWGEFHDIEKTKDISFCSADKEMCFIHKQRKMWAKRLENDIDCMGTYNGGQKASTYDIYAPYKFSVVIENYIDDLWFTEKICNAFANKCVPIYYGARDIDTFFNKKGIIKVRNLYDLPMIIKNIKYDIKWEYDRRRDAINDNFERVKEYTLFEEWFFKRWGQTLEGLYKGSINPNDPLL